MRWRRYTAADVDLLAGLWQLGFTDREIAGRLGRTPGSINQQVFKRRRAGDDRFPLHNQDWRHERRTSALLAAVMVRGRDTSVRDIAKLARVHHITASKILKQLGVALEPGRHRYERRLARLASQGLSNAEIAAEMGVTKATVMQVTSRARRYGIPVPYERDRPALRQGTAP